MKTIIKKSTITLKLSLILALLLSSPTVMYSKIKYSSSGINVSLGKPYLKNFKNVSPSNFSSIGINSRFYIGGKKYFVSPALSVERYLYSNNYHFNNSGNDTYRFEPVPAGRTTNRIELFVGTIGFGFGATRQLKENFYADVIFQPELSVGLSNRNFYFANGIEEKKTVHNNPVQYASSVTISFNKQIGESKRRVGAYLGVKLLGGTYTADRDFQSIAPYAGLSLQILK